MPLTNMAPDLIGLISLLLVILIVCAVAKLQPHVASILYVSLGIRIFFLILGEYDIINLPDSDGDEILFDQKAYEWSSEGFFNAINHFPGYSTLFLSWVVAIFYSLFGYSVLLAKSLGLLFSVGSVLMVWIITKKIWNLRTANKAGWVIALFPSMILYSVLFLREPYTCFFLLLALNSIVNWSRTKKFKYLIFAIISFIGASFFHGAMAIGLFALLMIVFLNAIKDILKTIKNFRISFKSIIIIFISIYCVSGIYIYRIAIPKIGTIADKDFVVLKIIKNRIENNSKGNAQYPDMLIPKTTNEVLYKAPLRLIYFTYAPFPWDVKKYNHLLGMLDGFLYIFLTYLMFCNRKNIWSDPALRIIFLIFLSYILTYGISVGNFGTGIRHRAKFAVMFIIFVAPLLPKFIFSIKKNRN